MARQTLWHDDYWLMLVELYMKKPVGIKPVFSRQLVDLGMELHVHPQYLHRMMARLDKMDLPRINAMMESCRQNPKKFARSVQKQRLMSGFGDPDAFYHGVEVVEGFERDFKPMENCGSIMPVMLVLILDLYFRLTPQTMAEETPEVADLAKQLRIEPHDVVEVLRTFCVCDPCIKSQAAEPTPLMPHCERAWQKYASMEQDKLSDLACKLKEYFS